MNVDEIRDLERALISKLAGRVGELGFDTKAKGQSFYRKTSFGRKAFHLSFIEHATDFDITADVAIRFDSLEELVNEGDERLTKKEKGNIFSLGAELGNISEGKQKRWTVSGSADVEKVCQSIMDAFVAIGIPYLDRYSNLESALEALSGDDKAAWLHMPIHGARAKRAIGLAFLLGQRDKFFEIASAKTEFLTSRNDFDLQSFLQLKNTLDVKLKT